MRILLLLVLLTAGCFKLSPSDGGSQAHFEGLRTFSVVDIALPPCYRIAPIGDFIVLDAMLRKRIASWAELYINGENLTDRHYIAT